MAGPPRVRRLNRTLRKSGSKVTWLQLKMILNIRIVFFVLITNKRRVKIREILWDFRGDSVISENVGNIKQVQTLTNEFNFDKLCFRKKCWYAGKEFIQRKCHKHFDFRSISMS